MKYILFLLLLINIGFAQNTKTLKESARQGDAKAQYELGILYLRGSTEVHRDYSRASHWIQLSAKQGDPEAQSILGFLYDKGLGVSQSYEEAKKWYLLAASQGSMKAQYSLALMYDAGRSVPQDFLEAIKWYRLAGEQGHVDAQYNLGLIYSNGKATHQEYGELMELYQLFEKGDNEALAKINHILFDDKGIQQDYAEAAKWFRLAAEQNHSLALSHLADLYEKGEGVSQDNEEAIVLFGKSCELGNNYGCSKYKKLMNKEPKS